MKKNDLPEIAFQKQIVAQLLMLGIRRSFDKLVPGGERHHQEGIV